MKTTPKEDNEVFKGDDQKKKSKCEITKMYQYVYQVRSETDILRGKRERLLLEKRSSTKIYCWYSRRSQKVRSGDFLHIHYIGD